MKRIIMMVLRNLLFVPWGWFMLNRYAKNVDNYTEGERYALLKKIVRRANKGGNITVQSYGVENIPNENGFMFYPNHQGLYDVIAIVDACPTPFSVVAKKEVPASISLTLILEFRTSRIASFAVTLRLELLIRDSMKL